MPQSIQRVALVITTFLALLYMGGALVASFDRPQVQDRLELYQTNLLLQATAWDPPAEAAALAGVKRNLLGPEPLAVAEQQLESAIQAISEAPTSLNNLTVNSLTVKLGLIQAAQGQTDAAIATWSQVLDRSQAPQPKIWDPVAQGLITLWQASADLDRETQTSLQTVLTAANSPLHGWFRDRVLERFYTLTGQTAALETLAATEQTLAVQALAKLFVLGGLPVLGSIIGVIILIVLVGQALRQRFWATGDTALLPQPTAWMVPWNAETILQVFIYGFFLCGQVLIGTVAGPLMAQGLQGLGLPLDIRTQAITAFLLYGLTAIVVILLLNTCLRRYRPLPDGWFQFQWSGSGLGWGVTGYLIALPIVIVVSLLNQQLWQGQGGSNPILSLALENNDRVALIFFFVTAAIAAPLFEEFLFRGFLLPSLTRLLPTWAAIGGSALIFAAVHLSVSEILPLAALGCVLGYVYTRTRNLLAPMLLHSLWNSGTLLGLILLGSSAA